MNSCCEGLRYKHKPDEAAIALKSECPELEKYMIEKLKSTVGGDYYDFWSAMFLAYDLRQIYDEKGREGLREAEKVFIEQGKTF